MPKVKKINQAIMDLPQLDLNELNQTQLCERFKPLIQDPKSAVTKDTSPEKIRLYFFVNHSWRLTTAGFNILSKRYRSYTIPQQNNTHAQHELINGRLLLNIDCCINSPWYIRKYSTVVWDPVAHFELTMLDGDLDKYISFKLENVR